MREATEQRQTAAAPYTDFAGQTGPSDSVTPREGGGAMSHRQEKIEPQYKPLGVLFAKLENGTVEFVVVYEAHIDPIVKAEIAERFGIGAREWRP